MNQSSQRGFTFIELMVVIGIISVLTAIGIPSYAQMKRNVVFNNSVEEVVNALRVAQGRAMSAQGGTTWGVHFESGQYTIYQGMWPATGTTSQLEGGVTIGSAATVTDVVFDRLSGTTASADVLVSLGSTQTTISIQPTGTISRL